MMWERVGRLLAIPPVLPSHSAGGSVFEVFSG